MSYLLGQADARRLPLPDRSVDLVFGSPPYCDARTYGIGAQRECAEWVDWMLGVTTEALRVARNCVVWIAAGVTRGRTYWPACEGLMWEWWRRGGSAYRPCYWHRVGIPGSGGNDWFRADVEYAMCFKHPGPLAWSENTAMGKPPKFAPGGAMSYRLKDGSRKAKGEARAAAVAAGVGKKAIHRDSSYWANDDGRKEWNYLPPEIANPGNLVETTVGGGRLGAEIAHENEAPFPEDLAEFFVRSLCPPGGVVLDPFSGSGTTVSVAERFGRHGVGLDLRRSQADIATQRLTRPHKPVPRRATDDPLPLFATEG